jgi:hypothetical protein
MLSNAKHLGLKPRSSAEIYREYVERPQNDMAAQFTA